MTKKRFLVYKIIVAMFLGVVIGMSVNYGNWYLPAISMLAAFAFLYMLKKRVKEVLEDERDYKIGGKAAIWAISAYTMISSISGIVLYVAGKDNPTVFAAGNVLLYSACFLMYLYVILFKVWSRKDERD